MKLKKLLRKVFGPKRPKPTLQRPFVPSDRRNDDTLTVNNLTPGLIDGVAERYGYGPITAEFILLMAEGRMTKLAGGAWRKLIRLERYLSDYPVPPMSDFDRQTVEIYTAKLARGLVAKGGDAEQAAEMSASITRKAMRFCRAGYRGRGGVLLCANCDHVALPAKAPEWCGYCEQEECMTGWIADEIPRPAVAWLRLATGTREFRPLTNAERATALDMPEDQVEEIRERLAEYQPLTEEERQGINEAVADHRGFHVDPSHGQAMQDEESDDGLPPIIFDFSKLPLDSWQPERTGRQDGHQGNEAGTDAR